MMRSIWLTEECTTRHLWPSDVVHVDDMVLTVQFIQSIPDGWQVTFTDGWVITVDDTVVWVVQMVFPEYPKKWKGPRIL